MPIGTGWTYGEIAEKLGDTRIVWIVREWTETTEHDQSDLPILATGESQNFEAACRSVADHLEAETNASLDGEGPSFHVFGDPGNVLVLANFKIPSEKAGYSRRINAVFSVVSRATPNA